MLQTKMRNDWLFSSNNVFIYGSAKKPGEKKTSKEDEKTCAELNSANRRLQAKCQLVQNSNTN